MKRFAETPNKLGFMRVLQVIFAINIALTIFGLSFVSRDDYVYSLSNVLDLLNIVFEGIAFWLIAKRMKSARIFIIAFTAFNIIVGSSVDLATGTFQWLNQLSSSTFDLIMLIYFATSRRAKAVLTNTFSQEDVLDNLNLKFKSWPFWRNLIIYYCVFAVVGHWMEAGFCMFIRWGLIAGSYDPGNTSLWRDWLYPFPPDGVGMVICVAILYPIKEFIQKKTHRRGVTLLLSFIINALFCTLIELGFGLVTNPVLQHWDYSNMFCNFTGQVCLQNSLAFGVASTLAVWVLYPTIEKLLRRVPKTVMNTIFVGVVVGYAILQALYLLKFPV